LVDGDLSPGWDPGCWKPTPQVSGWKHLPGKAEWICLHGLLETDGSQPLGGCDWHVVIFPRGETRAAGSRHRRCRAGNTCQGRQNGFVCTDYWKPTPRVSVKD